MDARRPWRTSSTPVARRRNGSLCGRPPGFRWSPWGCPTTPQAVPGLDAATGYLGRWSRYYEAPGEERDTLVTYLEEMADMLGSPALAARDKPGLTGGTLVWLSSIDAVQEDR